MSVRLIIVVTLIYAWVGIEQWWLGHRGWGLMYGGYALANIGVLIALREIGR